MDSSIVSSVVSAVAIVFSGLITLAITGRQESKRGKVARQLLAEEQADMHERVTREECLAIAVLFYDEIDKCERFPNEMTWDDFFSWYLDSEIRAFDNHVRRSTALGGTANLRAKLLTIVSALPDTELYAELNWTHEYEQFIDLLRLGGDLAADEARQLPNSDSSRNYEQFSKIIPQVLRLKKEAHEAKPTNEASEF